jgi:hypothetical protein
MQAGLLPAGARALEALPQAGAGQARSRHAVGRLTFFGEHAGLRDPQAFAAQLAPLRKKDWFVYAKPPFAGPQAVLAYLARYTYRVAIANSRLIATDDEGVTFTWKDYRFEGRDRHKTMTLAPDEFIRRFLLHVLPKGFHRIRHYGLLARAARRANIARVRELLAAPEPPNATRADDQGHRHGANRPSPAMPVLWRAHDRRRDLRARRRSPRPAVVRTRHPDRGRMTPNTPHHSASPPQTLAAGDRSITPSSGRSSDLNRRSRRHRPTCTREARSSYHRASALFFWNLRKRHANSIMPRRTRALPDLARPLSRRRPPLSSGEPVSPA